MFYLYLIWVVGQSGATRYVQPTGVRIGHLFARKK